MSISRAAGLAIPALAIAMLALTLVPAGVWKAPVDDAVYLGFDPNIMYTTGGDGGSVVTTAPSIDVNAPPKSAPAANLFTTPLQRVQASLDVTVSDNSDATEPFRIGVWSPWTYSGQFIAFGGPPHNQIILETITQGRRYTTLSGGDVTASSVIGQYRLGSPYQLVFDIDKPKGLITTAITGADGTHGEASLTPRDSKGMFGTVQVSLTASAYPGLGNSHFALSNYRLTLPHQRVWASQAADSRAAALLEVFALLGIAAVAAVSVQRLMRRRRATKGFPKSRRSVPRMVLLAVGLYLIGNAVLFPLGAHPFDMKDQQLFAYVARVYGPVHLFYLPNLVSLAAVWGGVPFGEFAFPYEPVTAYLSTATGWLNSLLFARGGRFTLDSASLEYLIKAINVLFGLGDAALIYLISRRIGVSERWSVIPAALFLFNPAVWFSMSVWGQTHVISLFFVLAAIYLAERGMPIWAWMALATACLTRPQMLVFGLLLGIVFLRKFSWQQNLSALSWTVIAAFLVVTPLTLATSPSLPVDIMLHNLNVQESTGNNPAVTTVSQGAYSIWPLVTYFAQGLSGLQRGFTPSADMLFGSLTYQRTGQVLTLSALLVIVGVMWFKRETPNRPGAYLPFVALGIASFLMFLTGIVSTHFLLALPFIILCRRWMDDIAYYFVVGAWSITTLVPMFGDMGVALMHDEGQWLSPAHNAVTSFFVALYAWDRFITVSVVANICAVIWIAVRAFRPQQTPPPARAAA